MRNWMIMVCWLVLATACDPCADCGKPITSNPGVEMVFINLDSLNTLNGLIATNQGEIKLRDNIILANSDSLSKLTDAINALEEQINAGNTALQAEKESYEQSFESLKANNTTVSDRRDSIRTVNTRYSAITKLIQSGSVQITNVTNRETGTVLTFTDSMTSFSLPLQITGGNTSYDLSIAGTTYSIGFEYELLETINEQRMALILARNIDTIAMSSSFDSLSIQCATSECLSNETTVYAYF